MQPPRGTRDLFGTELKSIRHVTEVMRKVFEKYGFNEVETPIFEDVELFTKKSGSSVVGQLYVFKDKSGRELALRPELTAPVVRLYIHSLKNLPKPLKLFYFGPCFRYEEPQANRWRQFTQSGVEIIGSKSPEADAEVLALSCEIMESLGIKFRARVGNVMILRELLSGCGVDETLQDPILRAIDSGDGERIRRELTEAGVEGKNADLVLRISSIGGKRDVLRSAVSALRDHPGALKAIEDLTDIIDRFERLSPQDIEVDLGIARGLDYYTGFVFEMYSGGIQLAGGGRYDDLVSTLGGPDTPAVGAGFGVDRTAKIYIDSGGAAPPEAPGVLVLSADEESLERVLRIASDLRRAGIRTVTDLMGRKLAKAMSYANSAGYDWVIIAGRKELSEDRVSLKNMKTGKQTAVSISRLQAVISETQNL
ncbi:MAG: histidine--tRNA ligase [Candidatus Hadarchaeales archaeon]